MDQYVVITKVQEGMLDSEWWNEVYETDETSAKIFSSFEEAKKAMREAIKNVTSSCKSFPMANKKFVPLKEYYEDCNKEDFKKYAPDLDKAFALLSDIVVNVISDPNYEYHKDFNVADDDTGDWYFAFEGDSNSVLILYYGKKLRFNVHNMENFSKNYYFEYTDDEDTGTTISIEMLKIE